jgi:uncharacterized protein (TIGR02611 family)
MTPVLPGTLKTARRVIIGIVGTTTLLVGVAMILLPGPAFLVIPAGLGILATEFLWAGKVLRKVREQIKMNTEKRKM